MHPVFTANIQRFTTPSFYVYDYKGLTNEVKYIIAYHKTMQYN